MNQTKSVSAIIASFAALAAVFVIAGCAEMEANNTKSLLTQAGFHSMTPTTPLQKEVYAKLPDRRVVSVDKGKRRIYAFKEQEDGIAYVGHEAEYQRYKNLCIQQKIQQDYYMATAMDPYWSGRWYGAYGYRGGYW